ncbi:hypothetical protein DCAR_0416624 [Daucus carota subsp. sativus]|uniref:Lethal giant larvae (Lgl)-like C-terminal domain-containing protein n=1 Tax=Daucus carota subsp. sativus TaxID=79200 RepID=A0AAF0WXA2_DAUCS|nr:hypothetical protein DCAR_0416624 [Daucus carota subsp. sativus]
MFVKKLVEKASLKKPGGNSDTLKTEDVNPRVVFHYGIPSGCFLLAYDSTQKILAISTKDGRIKLFGNGHSQTLLESSESVPSKFLQVWNIDRKILTCVHIFKEEVTSISVSPHTEYMYIGDSAGNISVCKLDKESCKLVQMEYRIPFSASHGNSSDVADDNAVMYIMPQPTAETKRVVIIYRDGFITLWDLHCSKAIFTSGGALLQPVNHETKKVSAACWACPIGSKLVTGYSNGDIFIWRVPSALNFDRDLELCSKQNSPIHKLNLGYKLDKIPIASIKWVIPDGKSSRLYVLGSSDFLSANSLQVVLLDEHIDSRTTKFGLHPPEPCVDMEIMSTITIQSKNNQDCLLLIGKSGRAYVYDDNVIEKYLFQCQSRSPPSLPKDIRVRLSFADPTITVAKFISDNQYMSGTTNEDYLMLSKHIPALFAYDTRQKDGANSKTANFSRFSDLKHMYITGHANGAICFWDVSCPLFSPIFTINQQNEDDSSLIGVPVTALYFSINSRLLISGDQSGMVRIFKFKPEPFLAESSFMSLQGSSRKGNNHIMRSVQLLKVNGGVLSFNMSQDLKQVAVGSAKGYVSVIDLEGPSLLYEKHIASELSTDVISLQFATCSLHGFEKNILAVATNDSSILALESDSGKALSSGNIRPKKPSRALFMQILDGQETSGNEGQNLSRGSYVDDGMQKQCLLMCSEKAVYIYSLVHLVQGIKKVYYKKKFQSSACCWASTMYTPNANLVLMFTDGKTQIRSLPELSLVKETFIRGLIPPASKPNSSSDSSICSSQSGEIIVVNGDQEAFLISVLLQKEIYRHLDSIGQVYNKDLVIAERLDPETASHKEKKKGIFSSVLKDMKGVKETHGATLEAEDAEGAEALSTIFTVDNFPLDVENNNNQITDDTDEVELLDIDDIDLEDPGHKPKGNSMMSALNKKKLASKFQLLKGKLKQMKGKNEKVVGKEEPQEEKTGATGAGTVDQIKKKYGYTLSAEPSAAKMAQNKLGENIRKLQGINIKTTEMQDNARSFSSMANELLRSAEHDRRSS